MPLFGDRRKQLVFIDSANFDRAARVLNINIDYQLLKSELIGTDSAEINFYIGTDDELFPRQKAFLHSLEQKGFNIIRRTVQRHSDNTIKANLDVEIAADWTRMVLSNEYSSATLVSGDGDFLPLIGDARQAGIHVTVVGLEAKTNRALREAADAYINLREIKDRVNRTGYGLAA
ncbi:MAG: NYN domain-containing protein [Pseudanabaena sp. SU_2_4]|nr:NYN domain-containing protein [Pseudanabaena sp. SU_2_4]